MRPVLRQFRSHVINATRCSHGAVRRFAGMYSYRGRDAPQGRGYSAYEIAATRNKIKMTSIVTVILAVTAGIAYSPGDIRADDRVHSLGDFLVAGVPCRLNNLGDVAGRAGDSFSGKTRATSGITADSRPTNLGNLGGGEYSSASGINDAGRSRWSCEYR